MQQSTPSQTNARWLLLAVVVLAFFLILLQPETGGQFSLTIWIVGVVIFFVATYSAFAVLWDNVAGALSSLAQDDTPDDAPGDNAPESGEFPDAVSRPSTITPTAQSARGWQWRRVVKSVVIVLLVCAVVGLGYVVATLSSESGEITLTVLAQRALEISLAVIVLAILAEGQEIVAPQERVFLPPSAEAETAVAVVQKQQEDVLSQIFNFIVAFIKALWRVVEALVMMVVKTATLILPTSARLQDRDRVYHHDLKKELNGIAVSLGLDPKQEKVITARWIAQIIWASGRANRERDADELLRWWQIILSASIPVLSAIEAINQDFESALWAGVAGASVAILTSIQQFRRPKERWQHYRTLAENYQSEFWAFINLDGGIYDKVLKDATTGAPLYPAYSAQAYRTAFDLFNSKMTELQKKDLAAFFSQVMPTPQARQQQQDSSGQQSQDAAG